MELNCNEATVAELNGLNGLRRIKRGCSSLSWKGVVYFELLQN